jgi:hypothetical protein
MGLGLGLGLGWHGMAWDGMGWEGIGWEGRGNVSPFGICEMKKRETCYIFALS